MYLKHIFHIASFNCKNQLTVFRRTDLFKLFHSEMKPAHNKQAYGPIGYQHTILRTISTFSQMKIYENPLISGLYTSLFKPDTRLYWKIFPHKPLYIFQQHTSALRRFLRSCPLPANLCNGIGYQFHRASIGIA